MKAAIYEEYGPPQVLQIADVGKPAPGKGEVLVRIHSTTVTAACMMMRSGNPVWGRLILGIRKPKRAILGIEFAGTIEALGEGASLFNIGDEVYGFAGFRAGTYAEYACYPETASIALKPSNLGFAESAAAVDGLTTALFFLRDKANIQPGQDVLIIGASGSIGSYAVQLAKHLGARVNAVCSTANMQLATSLGADSVIDYTEQDFTAQAAQYDIIFDTVGKSSFKACKASLKAEGCYIPTVGLINSFLSRWTRLIGGKRVVSGMSIHKTQALAFVRDLIEEGKIRVVIDRRYPLEEIVDAHNYVAKGHKKGNVVISLLE